MPACFLIRTEIDVSQWKGKGETLGGVWGEEAVKRIYFMKKVYFQ